MEFIILAVIILAVVAITQLLRIYELSKELRPNEAPIISEADNRFNARMGMVFLVAFFSFCIWGVMKWKDQFLPVSASKHGVEIDQLMNITLVIIGIPFVICNVLLFYFVYKYYYRKDRKADFFAHSNKLEAVWTIVPAVVLSALIVYGLRVWNDVTNHTSVSQNENPLNIELYARQFDWTVRYAGADNKLGDANFQLISGTNALGLLTPSTIEGRIVELEGQIKELQDKIDAQIAIEERINPKKVKHTAEGGHGGHSGAPAPNPEAKEEHGGGHHEDPYADCSAIVRGLAEEMQHLERMKKTIEGYARKKFISSDDDFLVKGEFHIPINKPVVFQFRAQDVIHSAFMPHFRAQMNCVPGMKTFFTMTPTITTAEMRKITNNEKFEYYLLCNKICGNAHYNMKMVIVVEDEDSYNKWVKEQKTFATQMAASETPEEASSTPADSLKPIALAADTLGKKKGE